MSDDEDLKLTDHQFAEIGRVMWRTLSGAIAARERVDEDAPGDMPSKMADAYIEEYVAQRSQIADLIRQLAESREREAKLREAAEEMLKSESRGIEQDEDGNMTGYSIVPNSFDGSKVAQLRAALASAPPDENPKGGDV